MSVPAECGVFWSWRLGQIVWKAERIGRLLIGAGLACWPGALACGQQPKMQARLAEIRMEYPCRDHAWQLRLFADSTFKADACSLVGLAIHEVGEGHASAAGAVPADTGAIVMAAVLDAQLGTIRKDGSISPAREGAWVVSLQIKGKPYSVAVDVNSFTGKITFRKEALTNPVHP